MTGALDGLKVVEIAEGVAGPYAAMLLGDAGADVLKVESLQGDRTRGWAPLMDTGESAVFWSLNRNKQSLALDLDAAASRPILESLVADADVLIVEDGKVPAGLDYETLHARYPKLIYTVLSGWGVEGPWANRPAGELGVQLASEWTVSLGVLGEPPVRLGADVAASHAAVYAVQAITAAIFSRFKSGTGQRIDVSMFGAMMTMRTTMWVSQSDPDEWGGFHVDSYVKPPDHGYVCKDGRRILIRVTGARPAVRIAAVVDDLGMQWVKDDALWPKFSTDSAGGTGRYTHEVRHLWERGLERWTADEAIEIFRRNDIFAVPLNDYPALDASPQAQHLGLITKFEGDRFVTSPWQFRDTPASIRRRPPHLGEHSRTTLQGAGLDASEVDRLISAQVVGG